MATAADTVIPAKNTEADKIVDFSPERLKAPFFLRVAAFCIDYMILIGLPIGWLVATRFFGEPGSHGISNFIWVIAAILLIVNLLLFPLLRGQTVGKMITGLTIVNSDGTDLRLGGILRRNVMGYLITVATLGLGFLISGINSSGRALHDFLGGTVVVRGRKVQL
jgi:uncharacterized RDD family membrane protein YckC